MRAPAVSRQSFMRRHSLLSFPVWIVLLGARTLISLAQSATPLQPSASVAPAHPKPSLAARRKAEQHFLSGAAAFERNHLPAARREFLAAQRLDPSNTRYPLAAEVARQYIVAQLVHRGAAESAHQHDQEARSALDRAMRLDPRNPFVTQYRQPLPATASVHTLAVHHDSVDAPAPIALAPQQVTHTFHLHMEQRQLLRQVCSAYGIAATIDQSVTSRVVPFDATDMDFSEALRLVQLATHTFVVALDPHLVLILADTPRNRTQYQHQVTETLYLPGTSNAELSDMENIARNVFELKHAVMRPSQGTITVRAPQSDLSALSGIYAELLAGRSEVQLDMHVYEIDRSRQIDTGLTLPNSATLFNVTSEANSILANNAALVQEIIQSGAAAAGDWQKIIALLIASGALSGTVFNNPFVLFGGGLTETGAEWNTTAANMLLNTSSVRSLSQIQLRVLDREEATFRVGEQYPIMTSSYSILSGIAGSSAQTTPQVQYTDLGLTLKATPHIGERGDITLRLDLQLSSLAGSSINNVPVLASRQYASVVSVPPEDSALLVSALSRQDARELTGIPGLSEIPGFGDATSRQDTASDRELVILITPHILRLAHPEASGPIRLLSFP